MSGVVQEWFSIAEAAILLGMDAKTVRRLISKGALPARMVKPGTSKPMYRIHRRHIDGFGRPVTNAASISGE
ncbi:helix-turn-helix domain-containing protein [Schaalia sp. lx-100]|uniref:helix-turn-helix domain-containing protein n=1 Tax=Schaalia sp. lx-100 TaxID=2899081 RepID=UPI001E39D367|nr:helix-turn-helix domain-containing protein [Schaalia sp. lx-100]MCD4557636.1 helix-turn-helix domain-containing protein [Schaalia sp. lx-100]